MPDPLPPNDSSVEKQFNPQVFLETGQKLIESGLAKGIFKIGKNESKQSLAALIPISENQWLVFSLIDLQAIITQSSNPEVQQLLANDANELNSTTPSQNLFDVFHSSVKHSTNISLFADSKDNPDAIIDALPRAIEFTKKKLAQMKANREKAAQAAIDQFKSLGLD